MANKTKERGPFPRVKYTGALAEPIYETAVSSLEKLGCSEAHDCLARIKASHVAKLFLLFDWYKFDPDAKDAWVSLAFRLALDHVPGMDVVSSPKPRRGRKKSWQDGLGFELIREVEALQKRTATPMGYREAIRLLKKNDPKKWRPTQASLETRHREAKRRYERIRPITEALLRQPPVNAPAVVLKMGGLFGKGPPATDEK
jgi:hypothetical protein